MHDNLLAQAFIYLLAAVLSVPIAKRLGLGSVLGYLLAGVAIGPALLGLVGGSKDVLHFAEFGVVVMLFLIGLELRPALLWRLRGPILGTGGAQVITTAVVVGAISFLAGCRWPQAVAIGFIAAMSSTAIVLQSLAEKGVLQTRGGQASFSVLLFQDIAVIPILAVMPMLATAMNGRSAGGDHPTPIAGFSGWVQALITLGAVVTVTMGGRYLLRPVFRFIAQTRLREIFTASALALVIGIALLMQFVGLSAALGTFLAGVVLADSEYRHQLEADLEPFKGLLLGLFFITVGAGIDFSLMASRPGLIALLVGTLIVIKFVVLLGLGIVFRLDWSASLLFAFALAQGGEFCFVLLALAEQQGVLPVEMSKPLVSAVAVSMAATPLLLLINERVVQPRFAKQKVERPPDEIDEHDNPAILAGFGRFGHIVGRLLRSNGFGVTVLDNDPDQVELLGRFGLKSFYGDATRLDLLRAAGAERAKLFICAIDNDEKAVQLCKLVQEQFPNLTIFARATSRQHAYDLMRIGLTHIRRDTFGSAVDLGEDALVCLGLQAGQAQRAARIFRDFDESSMRELFSHIDDEKTYVSMARKHITNLENLLRDDKARFSSKKENAQETQFPGRSNEENLTVEP
ncbi:MAG TPA: monovalent cation:proton antiporter-2 (CPA2) family protein [Chthoniobacteraceae bacterium]|nr:monovalent cation:proton antiporter-2 (CPA2) family protein [Chthoniobacteraceae bacterium]